MHPAVLPRSSASASSRRLPQLDPVSQADSDWRTPTEISDYRTTPDYAETIAYLERIAAAAPGQVRIEYFGKTGEGRELNIVIASKTVSSTRMHPRIGPRDSAGAKRHPRRRNGWQGFMPCAAARHRDHQDEAALLDHAVFVFIPVYNPDGHERRSAYNRINQNGPEVIGWRGNGTISISIAIT